MSNKTMMTDGDYDIGAEYTETTTHRRSQVLAERIERGARELIALASSLTPAEWETRLPKDGRKIGVIVHHVASMYPIEMQFALLLAAGRPIEGVTWDDIHALNGKHAGDHESVSQEVAIALLRENSRSASAAVRALSNAELDTAAAVSLNEDAPLTCQFFIEDHPLRHSFHHLKLIRQALGR
jgi:hypothetical protein